MKKIKTISLTILLSGITCGFIYSLLFTATGLSWYLNLHITEPQANISINNVQHSFNGLYTLSNFRYQNNALDIEIDRVQVDWNPLSIISGELEIHDLIGTNLKINIKLPNQSLLENNHLTFPLTTKLAKGSINGFTIVAKNDTQHSFDKINLEQLFLDQEFFAEKITLIDRSGTQLTVAGRFGFQSDSVINLTTSAAINLPGTQKLLYTHGTLVGNIAQLRFLQYTKAPYTSTIAGLVKNPFTEPYWEMTADINAVNHLSLSSDNSLKKLSGHLSASGSFQHFTLNGQLLADDRHSRQWAASLISELADSKVNFQL